MVRIIKKEAMLARDNYSFQKYKREQAKKKKKEEKLQRKLDKKNKQDEQAPGQAPGDAGAVTPDQPFYGQTDQNA